MDGVLRIKTKIDTKDYTKQIEYLKTKIEDLEGTLEANKKDSFLSKSELLDSEKELEKMKNQMQDLIDKQNELNGNNLKDIGNKINKSFKSVKKWGLALIGVRSAYSLIRNAINTISQYDEGLANDVEGIKNTIATALAPAINFVVGLVKKLLQYLDFITRAWFNFPLITNKANKSLNASNKSAQKLKKTLSGFDEINTIGSGDESGTTSSSGSLQPLTGGEIPGWVQWIADNGITVAGILGGIASAILLIKFGVDGLMALGIGVIIAGIAMTIQGIIDFINDPSWENFATILKGLAVILAGVAIAMIAVNAANPVAWILLAIAAVTALVALIIKYWDEIKAWLLSIANWIYDNVIKPVADFFVGLWDGIVSGVTAAVNWIKNTFNKVVTFFSNIINTIVTFFKNLGTKVGDAISGAFKTVVNGILGAVESILNFPIKSINKLIDVINKIPGIDIGKLPTFNLPRLAKGGIVDLPRTGVNIGGAIAGEAGPEAVIPLSDNTLQRLANMIPITIDLTTELDGRILNRRLEQVRNNNSFARNGVL